MSHSYDFDLVVVGSGPAGRHAAIQGAKNGKKTAMVEQRDVVGGVSTNTGTIPSKTLREAILFLTGRQKQEIYQKDKWIRRGVTLYHINEYIDYVVKREIEVARGHLERNGISVIKGTASFASPHDIAVDLSDGSGDVIVSGEYIVIAVGTRPRLDPHIPFDERLVLNSDDIIRMDRLPRTMAVLGGGVIGTEYASMLSALGVKITLIDRHSSLFRFIDREIIDLLLDHLKECGVELCFGEYLSRVDVINRGEKHVLDGSGEQVEILLESGRTITVEKALYSIGRVPQTEGLNLDKAGLEPDSRGIIKVDEDCRTGVRHIFAAGDVIGFPSLASTSMEQGRMAVCHAFNLDSSSNPELFPYGIYTIPEISYIGLTEEELKESGKKYAVGKAYYRELARGLIVGDTHGMLKLIFDPYSGEILGIHIIGEEAANIIHIGQAVMALRGTIDYFIDSIFNYPTLAEAYKVAAFDGINRLKKTD